MAPEVVTRGEVEALIEVNPRRALELGLIRRGTSRRLSVKYWSVPSGIPHESRANFVNGSRALLPKSGVTAWHGVDGHNIKVISERQLKDTMRRIVLSYGNAVNARLNLSVIASAPAKEDESEVEVVRGDDGNHTMNVETPAGSFVVKCYPADHAGSGASFTALDLPVQDDVGRTFNEEHKRPFAGIHNTSTLNIFLRKVSVEGIVTKVNTERSGFSLVGVHHALLEIVPLPGLAMGGIILSETKAYRKFQDSQGLIKLVEAGKRNLCVYAAIAVAKILHLNPASNIRTNDPLMAPAQKLYQEANGRRLAKGEMACLVDVHSRKFTEILLLAGLDPEKVNIFNYCETADGENYSIKPLILKVDKDVAVNFLIVFDHLMYIRNPDVVLKGWWCEKCSEGFSEKRLLKQHIDRGCKGYGTSWAHAEEDCAIRPQLNHLFGLPFEEKGGFQNQYFACYDLETYSTPSAPLSKDDRSVNETKLARISSWSVATNIPVNCLHLPSLEECGYLISFQNEQDQICDIAICTRVTFHDRLREEGDEAALSFRLYKLLSILRISKEHAMDRYWRSVKPRIREAIDVTNTTRTEGYGKRCDEVVACESQLKAGVLSNSNVLQSVQDLVARVRHARATRNAKPPAWVTEFYRTKRTLPIYGFNSSKFDLPVLNSEGFTEHILQSPIEPDRYDEKFVKVSPSDVEVEGFKKVELLRLLELEPNHERHAALVCQWESDAVCEETSTEDESKEKGDVQVMKLKEGCDTISLIKRGNQILCMTTGSGLKFLDLLCYSSPTTLAKTFVAHKCGGVKGVFPYDMATSYASFSHSVLITRKQFFNSLSRTPVSDEDYEAYLDLRRAGKADTLRDLQEVYNNGDVTPMITVIKNKNAFLVDQGLDMHCDAVSAAGCATKQAAVVCAQTFVTSTPEGWECRFPTLRSVTRRCAGYKGQDVRAGRSGDVVTPNQCLDLVKVSEMRCHYCTRHLTPYFNSDEDADNSMLWTLDRLNNDVNHNASNCVVACEGCNVARKRTPYDYFKTRAFPYQSDDEMCWVTGLKNKGDLIEGVLRSAVQGGMCDVSHRYHEAGVTRIAHVQWDGYDDDGDDTYRAPEPAEYGAVVVRVTAFDCNGQYPFAMRTNPVGKGRWEETESLPYLHSLLVDDTWLGMSVVDISLRPEYRKESAYIEMLPLMYNSTVFNDQLGEEQLKAFGDRRVASGAKLTGSFEARALPLSADLLR